MPIGVDILEVDRMRRELARPGGGMADAVFTPAELEDARRSGSQPEHLARCFAAKEALFKALGTGWADGMGFREVELRPSGRGYTLSLAGRTRLAAAERRTRRVLVDVAGTRQLALATVVLEQDPETGQRARHEAEQL